MTGFYFMRTLTRNDSYINSKNIIALFPEVEFKDISC